jgi:DNA polymerase
VSIAHLDLETRSSCDLKACGLDVYSKDPTTDVHCAAYAFDDEPVQIWTAAQPCPERLRQHIEAGGLVYAHNAAFEIALTNEVLAKRHDWPTLKPEQCRCTMCMAYAMALPGSLENAAPAVGLTERKDGLGKRVMLKLCKPNVNNEFWTPETAPDDFRKLYAYCKTDVEVERALHHRLMELSEQEQAVWTLDHKINQNGILVDLVAIDKALALVAQEKTRLDGEILKVTGGVVGSCTEVQLLVKWIKSQGVKITGLAKADVLDALGGDDLPPQVRNALELRKEAAKSSTAKLVAMRDRAAGDGRIRGIHQYHGASTGRWAGRGVQTQNLPRCRPGIKPQDVEDIIAHLDSRDYIDTFYGPTLDALSDSLRGMIIAPPGKDLVAVDFSNVEGRVLAWLAGENWKLEAFKKFDRGVGPDIYTLAYSRSFGIPVNEVTKEQRQIGKVMELALGYGGGVGAFQSMAKNYNVHFTDEQADQIKVAWRKAHPRIVAYWSGLEAALYTLTSGRPMTVGLGYGPGRSVTFKKAGSFLWCQLPSKRVLCYPYPEIREVTTPWGEDKDALTYMTVVSNVKAKILADPSASGTWKRISTYGGSICENCTQAVARDLLAEAMLRLDQQGAKIVAHVHDEAVIEIAHDAPEDALKRIEAIFAEAPSWAVGLPLAAAGFRAKRYQK